MQPDFIIGDTSSADDGRRPLSRPRPKVSLRRLLISRMLVDGPSALSDTDLLSILLPSKTAERVLNGQPLSSLLSTAHVSHHSKRLSDTSYAVLHASLEIARRHLSTCVQRGSPLSDPQQTRDYLRARMRDLPFEVFGVLFLDCRHRVIAFKELFRGTIDGCHVHPAEVVREAIALNSSCVIIVHNHPSGVAEPSSADQSLTQRLRAALHLVEVRVLDHLIVGDQTVLSFAERGLL
jgi:DNA repair protein RadC